MSEKLSVIERAASVIWMTSGDSDLNERHYRHARALADAGLLIDERADPVGKRALACVATFDGVESGNLMFDDAFLLLGHIVAAADE